MLNRKLNNEVLFMVRILLKMASLFFFMTTLYFVPSYEFEENYTLRDPLSLKRLFLSCRDQIYIQFECILRWVWWPEAFFIEVECILKSIDYRFICLYKFLNTLAFSLYICMYTKHVLLPLLPVRITSTRFTKMFYSLNVQPSRLFRQDISR